MSMEPEADSNSCLNKTIYHHVQQWNANIPIYNKEGSLTAQIFISENNLRSYTLKPSACSFLYLSPEPEVCTVILKQ